MAYKSNTVLKIDKNAFNAMCKNFRIIYKFDDAQLHMPHGKRALDVIMLSNLSLSDQTKLKVSRHKSIRTYACYSYNLAIDKFIVNIVMGFLTGGYRNYKL